MTRLAGNNQKALDLDHAGYREQTHFVNPDPRQEGCKTPSMPVPGRGPALPRRPQIALGSPQARMKIARAMQPTDLASCYPPALAGVFESMGRCMLGVDPAMLAMAQLAGLATTLGRAVLVSSSLESSHTIVPSVYVCLLAAPGAGELHPCTMIQIPGESLLYNLNTNRLYIPVQVKLPQWQCRWSRWSWPTPPLGKVPAPLPPLLERA